MDQTTLVYVMAAAIVVATAAIVVQAVLLVAMYLSNRRMKEQVSALVAKAEPALESARKLLEDLRRAVSDLSAKTGEVVELSRRQLTHVDEMLTEASTRTRVQMDRIEMVLDDVVSRFQQTTALVESGIVRPIRHINGLTAGIRAALAALAGAKTSVAQATHDEEMFI
jgi:polyhydroxyalkanoate synthesis regulator phasin